jgi:hypothetical protein
MILFTSALGLVPIDISMSSFGVAIKAGHCGAGVEKLLFEHNVSALATKTHGVITQQWHAGTRGDPRMRIYVDDEADQHVDGGTNTPAIDYDVSLAHGLSPNQTGVFPW